MEIQVQKRGRPAGSYSQKTIELASQLGLTPQEYVQQKSIKDPNAPKRSRGRPSGTYSQKTIEAAQALGLTPEEYNKQKNFRDPNAPKGKRGRPRKDTTTIN